MQCVLNMQMFCVLVLRSVVDDVVVCAVIVYILFVCGAGVLSICLLLMLLLTSYGCL